jgi:hypothetical protein
MQLLNIQFAILLIKIAFCVLPGVLGIFLIVSNEESKRSMRNSLCSKLFGVSNAIAYPKFAQTLVIIGTLALIVSGFAIWFILLRKFF